VTSRIILITGPVRLVLEIQISRRSVPCHKFCADIQDNNISSSIFESANHIKMQEPA
jgi:hypothetical protein